MVNQKIEYTDLDGKERSGIYSFNLSKQDFVRMQLKYQPGIQEAYQKMIDEGNIVGAFDLLADLIESSYGVREGDMFVKNRNSFGRDSRPDLANFKFHPAFDELMAMLMNDTPLLLDFFRNLTNVKMSDDEFELFAAKVKDEAFVVKTDGIVMGIDLANGSDMTGGLPETPVEKVE